MKKRETQHATSLLCISHVDGMKISTYRRKSERFTRRIRIITMRRVPVLISFCLMIGFVAAEQCPLIIRADAPATRWDHGYGVGNGRVSALTFGGFPKDTIVLNESSIYAKSEIKSKPNAAEVIRKMRELAARGHNREADLLAIEKLLCANRPASYQQGGLLDIEFLDAGERTFYTRTLNLAEGIVRTEIGLKKGGTITCELLADPVSDCVGLQIKTDTTGGVSVRLKLRHATGGIRHEAGLTTQAILVGQGGNGGTKFESHLMVQAHGADKMLENDAIIVRGAKEVLLLVAINTNYNKNNPNKPLAHDLRQKNGGHLRLAFKAGWDTIRQRTVAHVGERMARNGIDIGDSPVEVLAMTTAARIERVKKGAKDPDLVELLYQFGRYCMVVNCRPGALPFGLQGLWNPELSAPWGGCYFLNINLAMNYWCSELTGLGEYHEALGDFVMRLQKGGESFAKSLGYDGFVHGHNADIWGATHFMGAAANPEFSSSIMNGAWIVSHLVDHYRFGGDKEYLRKSLPILESNARFMLSWFEKDATTGKYVSGPASSPECGFFEKGPDGKDVVCFINVGNAHDHLLGRESLSDYLFACKVLGVKSPLEARAREMLANIPLPGIGADGRLLEWCKEYKEQQPHHRHFSHLYGLFPGHEFNRQETPEYVDAVKKSLDYRIEKGSAHTGWSAAWAVGLYAMLGQGDTAQKIVYDKLLKARINPNLFDMHPPFQIDGNMGATTGIALCLVQSRMQDDGSVHIEFLPALASDWTKGSTKGMTTRGGLVVNITWADGKATAQITATRAGEFSFHHKGRAIKTAHLQTGERLEIEFEL